MTKSLKKMLECFALLAECKDLQRRVRRMEERLNQELHFDIAADVACMPDPTFYESETESELSIVSAHQHI